MSGCTQKEEIFQVARSRSRYRRLRNGNAEHVIHKSNVLTVH